MENDYQVFLETVEIINMEDIHDEVYESLKPYSTEGATAFRKYLNDNKVTYYSAEKHEFNKSTGLKSCFENGHNKVILENLS